MKPTKRLAVGLLAGAAIMALSGSAFADHSWSNLHWGRTSNPFTVQLGDNVGAAWDPYLTVASDDWSGSTVLNTIVVPGSVSNPKTCKPIRGRVEICSSKYGQNGWLGIASVWSSGGHIVQGTVKMNDTYYGFSRYNTPAWRALVMCQEIGHAFGLDHQDETFDNANLNTCMDYTNDPESNQHPNAHDYEQLRTIYDHLDSTNTSSASTASSTANPFDDGGVSPSEWGRAVAFNSQGQGRVFVREDHRGRTVTTFVFWAPEGARPIREHN